MTKISAAAISRILKGEGIRKAPTSTYGRGFLVTGYDVEVHVHYQDTNSFRQHQEMDRIVKLLEGRTDLKYKAIKMNGAYNTWYVKVTCRTAEEIREIRLEQAAEESPFAVTKREVRVVLHQGGDLYGYSKWDSGFYVERVDTPAMARLVRVLYRDHPHTTYAPETGGREAYRASRIERYADKLRKAGYSVLVDGVCVLVGQPGEFDQEPESDLDRLKKFAQSA
jgi:hypothetical protein